MIELKVTVDAPELSAAINHLAEAIESKGTDVPAAPAKNSRSKKAAAKTAPDAPAASAPAPSEPVTPPTPVEQPPVAMPQPAPVQTPVAAPAQQPAPAAPVAAPMMPQPRCNGYSRDDPACCSCGPAVHPSAYRCTCSRSRRSGTASAE